MSVATAISSGTAAIPVEHASAQRTFLGKAIVFARRQPLGTLGLVLVLLFALAGIFADWLAPYNPTSNDFAAMTEAPSWAHWRGTDQLGRDLLSRILFGARTAFIVGLTAATVGGFSGLVLGVGSASGDQPDRIGQERDRTLASRVEQALGLQQLLQPRNPSDQLADADCANLEDAQAERTVAGIELRPAVHDHLRALGERHRSIHDDVPRATHRQ